MVSKWLLTLSVIVLAAGILTPGVSNGQRSLSGATFEGGAKAYVGTTHFDHEVNVVYAADSGT